ncbi:MAG: cache domain-containing protein, partial [Hydrogenophaga sp.]|nr:cache domain-containing protein [Hydrogenophaga sp.]
MKSLYRPLLALFASLAFVSGAFAQDNGTRDEAKAMNEAAIAHLKKVGNDKAFDDFTKDKANWNKKDLYVILMDTDGAVKSHGANDKLVGKNLLNLKDQNGKEFVKEFMAVA